VRLGAAASARVGPGPAGGHPLSERVATRIGQSLGVDVSPVRVHSMPSAAAALGARAFAYGRHVFLGAGERATDLPLMAHEVAHVVQQQSAPTVQLFTRSTNDRYETEARGAATAVVARRPFAVTQRTAPRIQRLGIGDALDYFAPRANAIPGFRMFTLILGVNPINMSRVDRSPANIMRAVVEFMPGGVLITQALDSHGVIDRAGAWVDEQIRTLGMTGAVIRQALDDFLHSLSLGDIFNLGGVWDRAQEIFSRPIRRIRDFVVGLVMGVLRFIKDAILRPLAGLASQTRGYDLLKAVLGQDPITGEPVPRNAETLIGGFMKLIGQDEVWENIKRANAIERAWAWFQGALAGLMAFVRQIPGMFISALQQLEIADLVLVPRAFARIASVFGGFALQFVTWAGQQVLTLLQLIFEVVAPGVMPYVRKAAGAFRTIIADPIRFIGYLVQAGIQGFRQFGTNFLSHLRNSLIQWLTGTLAGANIYIPQAFELREIIKFVLSVLGLTWQNIRQKLVRLIPEPVVTALETTFDIVVTLVREGPAAAWDKIREQISNLKEMVMEQVMTFVRDRIVQAAITRLVTSLNPAGAFIQAVIAIYNTIMFFVERLRQIAQVAAAYIDAIAAIASGAIGAAANKVEQTMAGLLTLVISFLARLVGLGRVSDAVVNIVNRIRAPIDRALDRVVEWIVSTARRLGRLLLGRPGQPPDARTPQQKQQDLEAAAAAARQIDPTIGHGRVLVALNSIRDRFRLSELAASSAGSGRLRIHAAVNPETTFEMADYDDRMLDDLHAGFTAATADLADRTASERGNEPFVLATFTREIRERHAGVTVALRRDKQTFVVTVTQQGLRPIELGSINIATGEASADMELTIRAATADGRQAIERLGADATLGTGEQVFRDAFTARMKGAVLEVKRSREMIGREVYLTVRAGDRRFLGVIVGSDVDNYRPVQQRGAQTLLVNRVSNKEFVRDAKGLLVQRYVWRNVNSTEAQILTQQREGIIPDLPPRAMTPGAPRGLRGQVAETPREHVVNAQMASVFSSATTIEGGYIVNRQSGQIFSVFGAIRIDLFMIDPDRIVGLSTAAGRLAWGLVSSAPSQEELDAAATREVLIRGGIPGVAIVGRT
jgi:Domain of unknown function (DUF4157)